VSVAACGVCHTDVHTWEGSYDLGAGRRLDLSGRVRLPLTLGHEIAGKVVACGPDAPQPLIGRSVVVYPRIGCGECASCRQGRDTYCAQPRYLGVDRPGGFADEVLVPDARYVVPFDRISAEQAAPLTCSGLTAYSALRKIGSPGDQDTFLMIGAGGVGVAALSMSRSLMQAPVAIADLDAVRLAVARRLGTSTVIDTSDMARAQDVLRHAAPARFAAAIDFVGSPATFELAWSSLRKGATLVVVGLFGGEARFPVPMLPARALTLIGSYVGSLDELKEVLRLADENRFPSIPITPRPMATVCNCLEDLRAGRVLSRTVLIP
jgi:D-arabinose 1-dehydrogenase-like Zn-dependent alcohol dehydrogenase